MKIFASILLFLSVTFLPSNDLFSQAETTKIDYTKESNIINPKALKGDEKAVFWHFAKLSSQEHKELGADAIKSAFANLGLHTNERKRFLKAYFFLVNDVEGHKKDCELWESFKDLAPK